MHSSVENVIYQFCANRSILVNIVFVLHFLVGHELQGAVRHAKHAGNETLAKFQHYFHKRINKINLLNIPYINREHLRTCRSWWGRPSCRYSFADRAPTIHRRIADRVAFSPPKSGWSWPMLEHPPGQRRPCAWWGPTGSVDCHLESRFWLCCSYIVKFKLQMISQK